MSILEKSGACLGITMQSGAATPRRSAAPPLRRAVPRECRWPAGPKLVQAHAARIRRPVEQDPRIAAICVERQDDAAGRLTSLDQSSALIALEPPRHVVLDAITLQNHTFHGAAAFPALDAPCKPAVAPLARDLAAFKNTSPLRARAARASPRRESGSSRAPRQSRSQHEGLPPWA